MEQSVRKDLILLVADSNIESALRGLLSRPQALDMRRVASDVHRHPERDPGCRLHAASFLQPFANLYAHALVVFDRDGCGDNADREALEEAVEERLSRTGWGARARVVVIDPELEIWVWSDSPEVDRALGWSGRSPDLRTWLHSKGLLDTDATKPSLAKEAMEAALRHVYKPRSSSIYLDLATSVSFQRCSDPAFLKLRATLQEWFSADE